MKFPLRFRILCVAGFACFAIFGSMLAGARPIGASQPAAAHDNSLDDAASTSQPRETLVIPGPLRSFLRMAGISQEISTDDVLPTLARNAALYGYQGGRETEYLVLVSRYVHLGRELLALAD